MIKRICVLLCFLIVPAVLSGMTDAERDAKIEEFITHFGNRGHVQEARTIVEELQENFPGDPYFHLLKAKIIWQELEDRLDVAEYDENFKKSLTHTNKKLVQEFHEEIENGFGSITSEDGYLKGVLYMTKAGFSMKFESPALFSLSMFDGARARRNADKEIAEGLKLLREAISGDPTLCSAYYMFALTKYKMIEKTNWFTRGLIDNVFSSLAYKELGSNFEPEDIWRWFEISAECSSDHYFTKELEWEKQLVLKQALIESHYPNKGGHRDRDLSLLDILNRLCKRFPENKKLRGERMLILMHLKANKN